MRNKKESLFMTVSTENKVITVFQNLLKLTAGEGNSQVLSGARETGVSKTLSISQHRAVRPAMTLP